MKHREGLAAFRETPLDAAKYLRDLNFEARMPVLGWDLSKQVATGFKESEIEDLIDHGATPLHPEDPPPYLGVVSQLPAFDAKSTLGSPPMRLHYDMEIEAFNVEEFKRNIAAAAGGLPVECVQVMAVQRGSVIVTFYFAFTTSESELRDTVMEGFQELCGKLADGSGLEPVPVRCEVAPIADSRPLSRNETVLKYTRQTPEYLEKKKAELVHLFQEKTGHQATEDIGARIKPDELLSIWLYTLDSDLYRQLTRAQREAGHADTSKATAALIRLREFAEFNCHLEAGIAKLSSLEDQSPLRRPPEPTTVYRGLDRVLEAYKPGVTVVWNSVTSTSFVAAKAKTFLQPEGRKKKNLGTFFKIKVPPGFGAGIAAYSFFQGEQELLLPATTVLEWWRRGQHRVAIELVITTTGLNVASSFYRTLFSALL